MFAPNFKYTNTIVTLLTKIAVARDVVLHSPLVPKWESSLRKDALVRSAHSSTSIEGNKLSLEQVSKLAEGKNVIASHKDKQEVLNYLATLKQLDKYPPGSKINAKGILKIHKALTKGTLENPADEGTYRSRYVVVADRITKQVYFYPPENVHVPGLVNELVKWLGSANATELDPVIESGIAHYELVRIHPFIDGNGRVARVLAALVLYRRGFDAKRFFSLDEYYDGDRQAYYKALRTVDRDVRDVTKWLEYFVEGVAASMETMKERVIRLSSERLRTKERGQIALTERQMQIIEFINRNGSISNKDVRGMFKISAQAAHKELFKLVKMSVLISEGKGRSLFYRIR